MPFASLIRRRHHETMPSSVNQAMSARGTAACAAVAAAFIGIAALCVSPCLAQDNAAASATTPEQKSILLQVQSAFTSIAAAVEPTVVNIKSERISPAGDDGDPGDAPGQPPDSKDKSDTTPPNSPPASPESRRSEATGSGVIVRADGYILTNDHVVSGADGGVVTVTLSDGRQFKGRVFSDHRSDLAIVKIDPGDAPLPTATFADSSQVLPGEWAIAVGSPFDLDNTMTVGVISATGRHQDIPGDGENDHRYYPDLIQTDAAINPGNSGGPLFNIDGKVVGINVAIESPVEGSAGIGFAIPSDIAQEIMHKLIATGSVTRGYLGVAPYDLTPALKQTYDQNSGAFVRDVKMSSPAWDAGLRAGDIITYFDNSPVTGEVSLRNAIADTPPGKQVKIEYVRDGVPAMATADITASRPESVEAPTPPAAAPAAPPKLGLVVRDLTAKDRQDMNFPTSTQGVFVKSVDPDSPAEEAAEMAGVLLEGAVVQKIDKTTINHPTDIAAALKAAGNQSEVTVVLLVSEPDGIHQDAITVQF